MLTLYAQTKQCKSLLRLRGEIVLLAVLFAVTVLGTSSCTAASTSVSSSSSSVQSAGNTSPAATLDASEQEVDLEELAQSLPEEGLPEKYIDKSWLGRADKIEKPQDGVAYYTWYSKNGLKDEVFFAACGGGVVVGTVKLNVLDYWPDYNGLPDLYAKSSPQKDSNSGEGSGGDSSSEGSGGTAKNNKNGKGSNKYNPRDYDSAEDWEADTGGSVEEWDRH